MSAQTIKDKSDAELAADAKMLVQELSKIAIEFKERGAEVDISRYTTGRMEVEVYRERREVL